MTRPRVVSAVVISAALGLGACGSIDSKSDGESLIKDFVNKQGKGRVTLKSVSCPGGVKGKAGRTFQCQLTVHLKSTGTDLKYLVDVHYVSDSKIEMHGSDLHAQI